jgi:GNAT superfamily N-acetyltransferase
VRHSIGEGLMAMRTWIAGLLIAGTKLTAAVADQSDAVEAIVTGGPGVLFLGQLYLSRHMQRQGIGTRVLQMLIEEARRAGKPTTLGVVKINPARRLYERLGFQRTQEDRHKVYMRL